MDGAFVCGDKSERLFCKHRNHPILKKTEGLLLPRDQTCLWPHNGAWLCVALKEVAADLTEKCVSVIFANTGKGLSPFENLRAFSLTLACFGF